MKSNRFFLLIFIQVVFFSYTSYASSCHDSIGVEKKDGKLYVLHQVDAKETLYSIAKKYSVKVEDIKSSNPDIADGLKVGQTLRVPSKVVATATPQTTPTAAAVKTHTVEKKETLYSISKKYNVSVEDLKKANLSFVDGLKEGQVINIPSATSKEPLKQEENTDIQGQVHLVESKETLFGISKKYGVPVDDIKRANPQLSEGLKEGTEIVIPSKTSVKSTNTPVQNNPLKEVPKEKVKVVKEEPKEEPVVVQDNSVIDQPKGEFKKITENGLAELLESKTDAPKFQALHKTAPVGTIIQVTNEANGQKIFVRVIGKLTNTSDNKVIIRISQKALDRLEAKESKIPVNISFIP